MHRNGLIAWNIKREIRKGDFYIDPALRDAEALKASVHQAAKLLANPNDLIARISYNSSGKKAVAHATDHPSALALRMLNRSLSREKSTLGDREAIVVALKSVLSEQVPFTILKLDVRGFYESFSAEAIERHLASKHVTPPSTRSVINKLVHHHISLGHSGLPRGLVISPTLADSMMCDFDRDLISDERIFFYRRFVDDIIAVVQHGSDIQKLQSDIKKSLPIGLEFKASKNAALAFDRCLPKKSANSNVTKYSKFNYLGYQFTVARTDHNYRVDATRDVWLDVAANKVSRIKTRLMRAYVDHLKHPDFDLLEKRVKHLTSNISIRDRSKGITRLSGIHFSYPLVDLERTASLRELDAFLRSTLRSTKGRVFRHLSSLLTEDQRRILLRHSFFSGAKRKRFYQFSPKELGRIQRCWKYE